MMLNAQAKSQAQTQTGTHTTTRYNTADRNISISNAKTQENLPWLGVDDKEIVVYINKKYD